MRSPSDVALDRAAYRARGDGAPQPIPGAPQSAQSREQIAAFDDMRHRAIVAREEKIARARERSRTFGLVPYTPGTMHGQPCGCVVFRPEGTEPVTSCPEHP